VNDNIECSAGPQSTGSSNDSDLHKASFFMIYQLWIALITLIR
jgi:hypothetical protein